MVMPPMPTAQGGGAAETPSTIAEGAGPDRRGGLSRYGALGLLGLVHLGFISLGLPDGLLGIAWPSIRQSFGIPLDALGALLLAVTVGALSSSASSGWAVARLGVGRLLALSGFATGAALLGYALAPGWWAMVALGVVAGLGAGAIDAGLNAYVALHHSPRHLHWLHASYGLGAALGPFIMTSVLQAGHPWRWGYAFVAAIQWALGTSFLLNARRFGGQATDLPAPAPAPAAARRTLRLPAVWIGVALFFVYVGIEATAGQWSFTLFTEARGVSMEVAGRWVSIYWGCLTAGRLLIGIIATRVATLLVLRLSMLGVLVGTLLLWLNPALTVGLLGLALIGLASAPIFSSLVSSTPKRLGPEHAANAIGFQVGAANLGLALVPGLAGVVADRHGLESLGPFLACAAVALLLLHEALVRRSA